MKRSLVLPPSHYPIRTYENGRIIYMTAEQLVRANREGLRSGLVPTLLIPARRVLKKKLSYPVTLAFHEVSTVDGVRTEYVLLVFYFSARMNAHGGKIVTLCITPDMWQEIVNNPAIFLD